MIKVLVVFIICVVSVLLRVFYVMGRELVNYDKAKADEDWLAREYESQEN